MNVLTLIPLLAAEANQSDLTVPPKVQHLPEDHTGIQYFCMAIWDKTWIGTILKLS
jgi:hypothetical protein